MDTDVRGLVVAAVLGLLLTLALPAGADAASFSVDDTTDTPVGQPCPGFTGCSLREAVTSTEANGGEDAILIAPGTYTLTNGQLAITQDLSISRVGAGTTTISGGGTSRILAVSGAGTDLVLRFLTLTQGFAAGGGGAIDVGASATLDVQSTSITNSSATGTLSATGGAIRSQGAVTIGPAASSTTGSAITGNSIVATSSSGTASGGGIATSGPLTIGARTTISGNTVTANGATAQASGGGVYAGVSASITDATIAQNTAQGTTAGGGGLTVAGAATLLRTTVSGNLATKTADGGSSGGGGIRVFDTGDLTLDRSTVAGNTASGTTNGAVLEGGGVRLSAGAGVDALRSTIAGNTVTAGAGSVARAGGVAGAGAIALGATILAENVPADQCDGGTITSSGHNVVGSVGTCGATFTGGDVANVTDAGLTPLASFGGLTQTMMLELGSSALDRVPAGAALCTAATTDQRGIARPQGGGCDTGAVEARPATLQITPDPRSFPPADVGQSSTANVAVSNTGDLAMTASPVASVPAPFSYTSGCTTAVAAGSNCIMTLTFAPTAAGAASETLTVTAGALSDTATLNGSGNPIPVATLTPAGAHDFGAQPVGSASGAFTYTLANTGGATLAVTSLALTGGEVGEFGMDDTCGATLAPGEDCEVAVRFAPTTIGAKATDLVVTTDAGTLTRGLAGAGTAPSTAPTPTTTTTTPSITPLVAPPAPVPALPLVCSGKEITILELRPSRSRLTVRGIAIVRHAGKQVTIAAGTQVLGTATVGPDGSFAATVRAPSGKGRARVTATVDGKMSSNFAVERRVTIVSRRRAGNRVTITARVTGARRGDRVVVRRSVSCRASVAAGTARVGAAGRVRLSLPLATAADGVALYRVTAPIGGGRTYTLPIAVTTTG